MKYNLDSYLFVLFGPSGVGKSTILLYFERQIGVESAPKYTTRPSRNTEEDARDFIYCNTDNMPIDNILVFESYGHLFGIQLNEIAESFRKGNSHVIIVGHSDQVNTLKSIYGNKVVVIFVFCDLKILKNRIFGIDDPQRASRWAAICEETSNIYPQLGCVNFVLDNSSSIDNTFKQIDTITSKFNISSAHDTSLGEDVKTQ